MHHHIPSSVNLLHRVTQHRLLRVVLGPAGQGHKPNGQKLTATRLDANFWPTPDVARDRFVLFCGLIAWERVSINKAVDDISTIEKDHLFTVLEEKLDYPVNLEEYVRKKAVKATISQIGTLQWRFKAHLRKKYVSEEETPFVKHAFLQQQD
jgi:hypothetical protein